MQLLFSSFIAAAAVAVVRGQQIPLTSFDYEAEFDPRDAYEFQWPIRKVAVIGAGVGGLVAYRELTDNGLEAHLFERDDVPGGNWHYTDLAPKDAQVPNGDPVEGDYPPWTPPYTPYEEHYDDSGEEGYQRYLERKRDHSGPTPLWESLHSNAPAPIQQIRELPWPRGTPWELPRENLQQYLRAFASWHGVNTNDENPRVSYNTRVEHVDKRFDNDGKRHGWTVTLKKLVKTGDTTSKAIWWTEDFDAVVIASGRYNSPSVPDIPGLQAWVDHFPDSFSHSRQYRRPDPYVNKTVLIIGGSTSATEITRELCFYAKSSIESVRPDRNERFHVPTERFLSRLPKNATVVGEIKQINLKSDNVQEAEIVFTNGTILTGVDHIIAATGYRYTYPFLSQYHDSSLGSNDTAPPGQPQPLITDGTHIRSLYLDVFYIEEPTIGFININVGMQSFTYSEFTSLALAKVWSGKAKIPNTPELWRRQHETIEERGGYGKHYQFLGGERTNKNVRYFISWLNTAAVKYGGRQIDSLPIKDLAQITSIWFQARFGFNIEIEPPRDGDEGPNNFGDDVVEDLYVNNFW